jgi:dihydrofolate reductase
MITLIAACSKNRVIGKDNKLIWHIPDDLKRFKKLTGGNPILMGRKTFESIGRALPNRVNIILTRDKTFTAPGCLIYNNLEEVIALYRSNLWVIGGSEIYSQLLSYADCVELTLLDKEFEGDSYFPELPSVWKIDSKEDYSHEGLDYSYITYRKS